MNRIKMLANRLWLYHKEFKVTDICGHGKMSSNSVTNILEAKANVTGSTVSQFDKAVGANGISHLNFALDRLYVVTKHLGLRLTPTGIILPASYPADFKTMLLDYHPIFQPKNNEISTDEQAKNDSAA